jgi:hypothetical protein
MMPREFRSRNEGVPQISGDGDGMIAVNRDDT